MQNLTITDMDVLDIRFPTSTEKDGSDAMVCVCYQYQNIYRYINIRKASDIYVYVQ